MAKYDLRGDFEDTIPVRGEEDFDHGAVEKFLRTQISDLPRGPLEVRQFPSGASNLTYLLTIGSSWEGVLRRPPLGPVAPKAHDMRREFWILERLNPVFELAPKPYLFCEDANLIGASFYVMQRRRGLILDDRIPEEFSRIFNPELARNISELTVGVLARLHGIDWRRAGFSEIAHPERFLERQVAGWIERYNRAKTDEVPEIKRLIAWLSNNVPPFDSSQATIIHNDCKLNNIMLGGSLRNISAVLDWEMCTVGDPLFDLAVTLSYWFEPSDPEELRNGIPTVTTLPGFYSREEFVKRYEKLSGRETRHMDFYLAFSYFKLVVINQQIYVRWKRGQTHDGRFARLGPYASVVAREALKLIG